MRLTVSGTKKCPEEPRLRVTKPIREPVESFGIRCPSGQEQLWAWPTRLAMGDIHKVRDFEVATRGHLHSRLHSPLDGVIPSPPANSTRVLLGQAALAPLEVLDPKRKD